MNTTTHLKLLKDNLSIPSIIGDDAKKVIKDASDIFNYIDSDFVNYKAYEPGTDTVPMFAQVWEQTKDGTFEDMFESLPGTFDDYCWSQAQIISFCVQHRQHLRQDGYATFFPFKSNGSFFVVNALNHKNYLGMSVCKFDFGYRWPAENRRRLVVPKLNLTPLDHIVSSTLTTSNALMLGFKLGKTQMNEELMHDIIRYIK